jgi:hypothetical protein
MPNQILIIKKYKLKLKIYIYIYIKLQVAPFQFGQSSIQSFNF